MCELFTFALFYVCTGDNIQGNDSLLLFLSWRGYFLASITEGYVVYQTDKCNGFAFSKKNQFCLLLMENKYCDTECISLLSFYISAWN